MENIEELIEKYSQKIYNLHYSLCGNTEEAKDLTQITFIRAFKAFDKFLHKSDFYTWLYRIAINCWKNKLKYNVRHGINKTESLDNSVNPETDVKETYKNIKDNQAATPLETIEKEEAQKLIRKSIRSLPEKYRIAIVLYIRNLSYEEIAQIMKCSVGQAKSLVFRAKALLKEKLENKSL